MKPSIPQQSLPSTPQEIQRINYRDKFKSLSDNGFQAWFEELARALHPVGDFQSIRLTRGDGGLDGLVINSLHTYQVFAPPRMDETRDGETAQKIRGDFAKAKGFCKDKLRRWTFVHNHPTGKIGKLSAAALVDLKTENPEITFEVLSIESLWDRLQELPSAKLAEFFGPPLTRATMLSVTMHDLEPVVDAIRRSRPSASVQTITQPSREKLAINKFSEDVRAHFALGRLKESLVGEYFSKIHRVTLGEQIAESFRGYYLELRAAGNSADRIFEDLMEFSGYYTVRSTEHHAATLAILVYYFERCDIFENSPRISL